MGRSPRRSRSRKVKYERGDESSSSSSGSSHRGKKKKDKDPPTKKNPKTKGEKRVRKDAEKGDDDLKVKKPKKTRAGEDEVKGKKNSSSKKISKGERQKGRSASSSSSGSSSSSSGSSSGSLSSSGSSSSSDGDHRQRRRKSRGRGNKDEEAKEKKRRRKTSHDDKGDNDGDRGERGQRREDADEEARAHRRGRGEEKAKGESYRKGEGKRIERRSKSRTPSVRRKEREDKRRVYRERRRNPRSLERERDQERRRREEERDQERRRKEDERRRAAEAAEEERIRAEKAVAEERRRAEEAAEAERAAAEAAAEEARRIAGINVKHHRKDQVKSVLGYDNDDNPFNDTNLTEKFVWKKRTEFLHAAGLYEKPSKQKNVEKIDGKIAEIQRVKLRRDERVVEQALLEEQRLQRERELLMENFEDWESKERSFHLEQVLKKSQIRIQQGREKPIDLIHKAMQMLDGDKFEDNTILESTPHVFLPQMHLDDLRDMKTDIADFKKVDQPHIDLWLALEILCDDAIDMKEKDECRVALAEESGIPVNIYTDVHGLLSEQTIEELEETKYEVEQALDSHQAGAMDTTFMEAVRKRIPFYLATRRMIDLHHKAVEKISGVLREKAEVAGPISVEAEEDDEEPAMQRRIPSREASPEAEDDEDSEEFEPTILPMSDFTNKTVINDASDLKNRERIRNDLIKGFDNDEIDTGYDLWKKERDRGLGDNEANFNSSFGEKNRHGVIDMEVRAYEWDDKYKPRKPRFFNRVKTGFSWSKYNKSHYDMENPPPKMVCGYRFNIFYPDLIDTVKGAPKYVVEKSDAPDTIILRFTAGPPYEDIAFKIVNKEWMINPRQGFMCRYDKGVLQLNFNVKRNWYKR